MAVSPKTCADTNGEVSGILYSSGPRSYLSTDTDCERDSTYSFAMSCTQIAPF